MKPIIQISSILFQIGISFCCLFSVYMYFAIIDTEEVDMINEIMLFTVKPLFGIVLISITISFVYIIGLPIRIYSKLNEWWKAHSIISLVFVTVGIIFLALSLLPYFEIPIKSRIEGKEVVKNMPNELLLNSGWFILTFGLLHYYPKTLFNIISIK